MMTHLPARHPLSPVVALSVALLLLIALAVPATVLGHAELDTSDPADGATVEGPYAGPIVMTFTETLEPDSNATLHDGAGRMEATSVVDGLTITLTPGAPLTDGEYEVQWSSFADDGHLERGTFRFTVLPAATPKPTASPTPTPDATASATASADVTPSPAATPTAVPSPTAPPDGGSAASGSDVLLPIIAAVVIVGGLAIFLLRRRDSGSTPS